MNRGEWGLSDMNTKETLLCSSQGHFWAAPSHWFEASLNTKPLIWRWCFFLVQVNLIFTRKVLLELLASFQKWEFLELGNDLLIWPSFWRMRCIKLYFERHVINVININLVLLLMLSFNIIADVTFSDQGSIW